MKKFLAILLTLMLCIGALPMGVMAEGETAVNVDSQEALATALSNAQSGTVISLADGTYDASTIAQAAGKTITFRGGKGAVLKSKTGYGETTGVNNATLIFEGITVEFGPTSEYTGFAHTKKVEYIDCTIKGQQFMYAPEVVFTNCTFDNKAAYCVWTYGSKNVTFSNCTFNTGGKAVLVYNEMTNANFVANITLKNCTFNSDGSLANDKAAVETGSNANNTATSNKYDLTFENCTVTGFAKNNSTSVLWGNKNSMDAAHLSVVIDGADKKCDISGSHEEEVVSGKEATCTEAGLTDGKQCKVCGEILEAQKEIAASGHSYDAGQVTTEATCTAAGVKTFTCAKCSTTYTEEIPTTAHTYDDGKVTTAATCTAAGVKTFTCAGCGHTYTEAVSAAGHTVVVDQAVAATYTATGLTEGSHCSVCEAVIVAQKVVPMLVEVKNEVAAVPDENVNVAIDSAKEEVTEGKATVTLDVVSTAGATETVKEAEVTAAAITTVLEMTKAEEVSEVALQVELSEATVTLDAAALEHIAEKSAEAATVTISVEKVVVEELPAEQKEAVTAFTNPVVISAEVLVDGVKIASEAEGGFNGGKVTVAIPFEAEEGTALSEYTIIYIDDAGKLSIVETSVENGKLVAALEHLSEYAVVLKTEAKEIVEQEAAEEQKPSGVAPTNDGAQFGLWIALMAVAGAGLFLNKRSAAKNDR